MFLLYSTVNLIVVTFLHPYWTFKYFPSETKLFVVNSYFSTDDPLVNSSNLVFVNIFSLNKSVYKLSYASFGVNLTIDGLTTVPS